MVELITTDLLSPNMNVFPWIGTPKYRRVVRISIIWSTAVLAATNSEPDVAVSTVACHLQNQSNGVWFIR